VLLCIDREGSDPTANLAYEETLFARLRGRPDCGLLFYVNSPCIVLGRGNKDEQWVDRQRAEADGLPVLRRFSGGGTVYHDRDNLNYSFIIPRDLLDRLSAAPPAATLVQRYIHFFRSIVVEALSGLNPGFSETGLSDISLNGLKVSGNAQRIASDLVLHHGTLMLRCPLAAIERYLPIPPNRPGIRHADFISGLAEQGVQVSMEELRNLIAESFARRLGLSA